MWFYVRFNVSSRWNAYYGKPFQHVLTRFKKVNGKMSSLKVIEFANSRMRIFGVSVIELMNLFLLNFEFIFFYNL